MSSRTTGSTSAQPPDVTIEEMYTFFGLIIQIGHCQHHSLNDYWSREEQYCTPFYSNIMGLDRFFHLAVDEVIVLYKGRVVFRQYIPKKHKRFGIKIYKLCDSLGYTYDMSVYLDKQRQHATAQIKATHRTVLQVIRRVEGLGHKIFMDNYVFHLAFSV